MMVAVTNKIYRQIVKIFFSQWKSLSHCD